MANFAEIHRKLGMFERMDRALDSTDVLTDIFKHMESFLFQG